MKKYSTVILTDKGEKKEVSVFLDDKTANSLDEANDIRVTQAYIADEYHDSLIARKETRKHISLEYLVEKGYEIADNYDRDEELHRELQINQMRAALETLTERQYKILMARYIDDLSFREIGRKMGISKNTVSEHFYAAEEKIKIFFEKYPPKT